MALTKADRAEIAERVHARRIAREKYTESVRAVQRAPKSKRPDPEPKDKFPFVYSLALHSISDAQLAELLDTTPENVSQWRNYHIDIPRSYMERITQLISAMPDGDSIVEEAMCTCQTCQGIWPNDVRRVYIIGPAFPTVKVGFSTNPIARLKQIQTGFPFPVFIHHSFECVYSERVEAVFHYELTARRLNGEWFDISASAARKIIMRIIANGGVTTNEAKKQLMSERWDPETARYKERERKDGKNVHPAGRKFFDSNAWSSKYQEIHRVVAYRAHYDGFQTGYDEGYDRGRIDGFADALQTHAYLMALLRVQGE